MSKALPVKATAKGRKIQKPAGITIIMITTAAIEMIAPMANNPRYDFSVDIISIFCIANVLKG